MPAHKNTCIMVAGIGLGAVLLGAVPAARAQDLEPPRRRQGYYIAAGAGNGGGHVWEDGDAIGAGPAGKYSLRLGQLLTPRWGLGLIIEFGGIARDNEEIGGGGLGFEGNVALVGNLALRASAGFAVLTIKHKDEDRLEGAYGAQYGLGLSWDWFPGRSTRSGGFAITPTFDVRVLPESSAASVAAFVGVEFVWWTGLKRNQLALPENEAYKKD
jgi:hypothetical protein